MSVGWLCPQNKVYDPQFQWLWGKLRFTPARFGTRSKVSSVPTQIDTIGVASIQYASPPVGRTRYNLASKQDVENKGGQAGVFLTYIEFLVEQQNRVLAGQPEQDITELAARLPVLHREAEVQSDDDDEEVFSEDGGADDGGLSSGDDQ